MKYFYAILTLIIFVVLEYIGLTMADKLEKFIPNKLVSTAIIFVYSFLVLVALVSIQVKLGIFGER